MCRWLAAALLATTAWAQTTAAARQDGPREDVRRPAGWDPLSHGAATRPDYQRLFSTDVVHEIRLVIAADTFKAMQEDLREVLPAFGRGMFGGGRAGGPAGGGDFFAGMRGRGGRGGLNLTTRDPMYVKATVQYDGRVWTHVGMRYKGNSSLMVSAISAGGKIPFRLDFDRYEKDAPEITDQRFHGFKKLTFSSNFGDDSQLREAFAAEVFRDRGVPAPRAAFYRVFVDTGDGPQYWGLYTLIEDPADGAMLDAQFGGHGGNLYKPDGSGADWTRFDKEGFPKKTNEKQADFTDIESAIAALHAPKTDPRAWRAALESRFDVDLFLRWLAVNTAIQNWDVYGALAHNYYLYGDPGQKGRLRWIPWDNNFAFGGFGGFGAFAVGGGGPGGGFMPGFPPPGGPPAGPGLQPPAGAPPAGANAAPFPFPIPFGGGAGPNGPPFPLAMFGGGGDVLHAQAGSQWPLLSRLLDDDVYATRYRELLQHAVGGLFAPEAAARRLRQLHALIAPSVTGARGERATHTTISSADAFERSVDGPDGLLATIQRRHETIRTALEGAR